MDMSSFSTPQWRNRKLTRYLYKILKHVPTYSDDDQYQYFIFLQAKIEHEVHKRFQQEGQSFLSKIFTADIKGNIQKELGLDDAMIKKIVNRKAENKNLGGQNRFQLRALLGQIDSPALILYTIATQKNHNFEEAYAKSVMSLSKFLFGYRPDFDDIKLHLDDIKKFDRRNGKRFSNTVIEKCDIEFIQFKTCESKHYWLPVYSRSSYITGDVSKITDLFNIEYLKKNPKAPAFMINSIEFAYKFQKDHAEICNKKYINNVSCQLRELRDSNEGFMKISTQKTNNLFDDIIDGLELLCKGGDIPERYWDKNYKDKINKPQIAVNYSKFLLSRFVFSSYYGGTESLKDIDLSILDKRELYWVIHLDSPENTIIKKFLDIYSVMNKD